MPKKPARHGRAGFFTITLRASHDTSALYVERELERMRQISPERKERFREVGREGLRRRLLRRDRHCL